MLHPENGSYEQILNLSENLNFEYVIKDKKGFIHLLRLNAHNMGSHRNSHCKVALFDLIPDDVLERIHKGVSGILANSFCTQSVHPIPFDVVNLIAGMTRIANRKLSHLI